MRTDLSDEALDYGRVVRQALEAAGGDRLVQDAEAVPGQREGVVAPVLAELGAWDLDPRGSADEVEAAAALCRSAGYWAVPSPVAERLSRPRDLPFDADGLVVVPTVRPAARLADLDGRWIGVTLDGARHEVTPCPPTGPARRTSFVADLDLTPLAAGRTPGEAVGLARPAHTGADATAKSTITAGAAGHAAAGTARGDSPAGTIAGLAEPGPAGAGVAEAAGDIDVALGLVLPCWTLLGMLDRALELTQGHVVDREQFGQPLASFQSVQFQLTDAEVERAGMEELAKYALWSIEVGHDDVVVDALALRLAAIEAAETVFRVAHQLHGATGFCDETPVSWLSRHSQPLRRLPLGLSATRDELTRRMGRQGLAGLFEANCL